MGIPTIWIYLGAMCLLARTKGQSISISSTYIVFLTEMQKRQTLSNGFALLKNDITSILKL